MKVAVSDGLSRVLPICKRTPIRFVGLAALVILLSGVVLLRMNTFTHDDLRQHLTAARDSVYLVGHVRQDGTFAPGGTAWAVGKRMLATNAHVADLLQKFADNGMRTIARLPGTPPRDITINSITVHPGYRRLEPLMIANFQARGGEQRSMLPAFDVALLCVAEDAGRPLPLASDAEVRRIRGGEPVGYVGFPMENLMGMQGNQPPTIVTGGITAAHDALGQCAAERMNIVFQHNLQITGGSSGSPILNAAGQVVALNNAGHFAHVPGARISVGLNLAQRVDLLREMLEDRASSELVEHERYLVPQIRAAGANLADLVLARILRLVGEWLQSGELSERARPIPHPPWMETLREPARGRTFAVSLERGRHYVLVACAADFSSLKLELEVNGHIDESSEGLCPSIALRSAYQGPATIRVTSISGGNGTPRVLVQMAEIAN